MTTPAATRRPRRSWVLPVLADLGCVVAFAVAGRGAHEPGASAWVVAAIVWPFALAVLLVHAGLVRGGRSTDRLWPEGVVVWAVTSILGMVLRVVSGRGVDGGFPVVALVFLLVTILGWRALWRAAVARRAAGGGLRRRGRQAAG